MTERKSVLIGDENSDRANWLSQFLNNYYSAVAKTAGTFDEVCMLARENNGSIIFLTDSLPYSYDQRWSSANYNFTQLAGIDRSAKLVCVVTGDVSPTIDSLSAPQCYVHLSSVPPSEQELALIVKALKPLKDHLPRTVVTFEQIAKLTTGTHPDLKNQITSLSNERDLKAGWNHFHRILRECIDFQDVKAVSVEPLTQGKSGALVFRLNVEAAPPENGWRKKQPRDFVLKLSRTEEVWKLQSEVRGYLDAAKTHLYSSYKSHVPALQTPHISRASLGPGALEEEFNYIATSLPWDAIYYDFLGGDLGECMSLETALISSAEKIKKRTEGVGNPKWHLRSANDLNNFRKDFLATLLDSLCDIWYLNKAFTRTDERVLWSRANAEDRGYPALPPYMFTKRTKDWLQEFLDSDDAEIGSRLFKEWNACRDRVLALIDESRRTPPLGVLGQKHPVVLSSVHGDLNSGNAFLWLREEKFPFLIDLPFYQSDGHAMQDFARLEVELKFALMDRQEESPAAELAAFDLSPAQVPLWRELEKHLLHNGAISQRGPQWKASGYRDNVRLTFDLVKLIRARAQQVHEKFSDRRRSLNFMQEYLPALLYHTVRAATYPSLSVFKRLLAVYSAGSILKDLRL